MSRYETMEDPEQAIEELFDAFKEEAFSEGWESALLDAASSAPVIRLDSAGDAAPLPAPTRQLANPSFWARHRLTAVRAAAAVVFFIGLGGLLSLLPGNDVNTVGDQSVAIATTGALSSATSQGSPAIEPGSDDGGLATPIPTTSSTPSSSAPIESEPSSPTTVPPTTAVPTIAVPTTAVPTTATPTTRAPTTAAPTTPVPTTAAPTTSAPTTTVAPTTEPPTTTETTVKVTTTVATTIGTITIPSTLPPVAVDIRIRGLAVSNVTSTSAVVSFKTTDCAGARYQTTGGVDTWADGYPNGKQCWTEHFARLGSAPFSQPLEPGKTYRVRVTSYGADGSTDSARISFTTLDAP